MTTTDMAQPILRVARPGSLDLIAQGLREIWSRRRLARYLVQADLAKHGANTFLGNLWWILDPLLQMGVYSVLVTLIFKQKIDAYPLFVFCAILPWKWFSSSVNDAVTSVVSREQIIRQLQFPKIVLPVASTVSGIANFVFGLIPLFALQAIFFASHFSPIVVLLPIVMVVQFAFTLAVAIVVSAINVFYRDVGNMARHVLRIWFYLSPALYSVDQIQSMTESHRYLGLLWDLNPFTVIFGSYRDLLYSDQIPAWQPLATLLLVSLVLIAAATLLFKRLEPAFAKVL